MKCKNCGTNLTSLGVKKCPHCIYVPPEIYIPFSWVALWLWGDRSAANPCHGFISETGVALRGFTAYPDANWPNVSSSPRQVIPGDTPEIRLEADSPRELCRMREKIRGVLTTL